MDPELFTRRNVILGVSGAAGLATILEFSTSKYETAGKKMPSFKQNYTTQELKEPILQEGPSPKRGPPFYAAVITSQEEANKRIVYDVLPESRQSEWQSVDYSTEFLAVFLSRFDVQRNGYDGEGGGNGIIGDQPDGKLDNGTFEFQLDGSVVGYYPQNELYTQLERWKINEGTPPENAAVTLAYP